LAEERGDGQSAHKVVQRVPVKIVLDDLPPSQDLLGLGMSVVPTVRLR